MELILLTLLMVKHTICDYIIQSNEQIKYKGIYGHKIGISHSLEHGIGTILVLMILYPQLLIKNIFFGIMDTVIHYHIDWAKVRYFSQYSIEDKIYWFAFGTDQLYHYLTYVTIILLYVAF